MRGVNDAAPTEEAASLLAEAFARASVEPAQASAGLPDGVTASSIFDEAYGAAKAGDFEAMLHVLERIMEHEALLQALLQAQSDDPSGHTMLHQAASHGSVSGVQELLRLGADATRMNAVRQSSMDVAHANGHMEAAQMLRTWTDAWSGWDAEELTVLACLYHDDQFESGEDYLRQRIEEERDHNVNLFQKVLPSGITMLDIAAGLRTP